jgi:peptidoglycan hydrolase-like protein with peptidoglycan-binding domain
MVRYSSAVRAALWLPLRTALAAKGFDPGSAEGIFGDGTEAELKAFL